MPAGAELVVVLVLLHVFGAAIAVALLYVLLRGDGIGPKDASDDDGEDGGGNDRLPPPRPRFPRDGGLPLPDAQPARFRLREPVRLGERWARRERRPAREPIRTPRHVPARGR